ncbi:DUF2752 domain-containing protein [Psychroflexus sp. YR1-1]|uniref:DUF2752 domain-containing protein n=1 Tax=Psychroflexus aurantiacus TaxID=2709310 RepID=A0A6B3QYE2_9FLAO|nr:DUF2752 domain-containing protein [Psychroflexus aurantiacus]NEV93196.1 DUF2752 domain-containing protein [Psychroflexus aurantiacus]
MLRTYSLLFKISIPIVILTLGIFYFFINPVTFAYTPQCPFHSLTGLHCPGCGSQRAFHEILHGNIWGGLQHNFLILLAVFVIGYKVYRAYLYKPKSKTTQSLLHHNAAPWIILALVLGFWILRNIPLEPFLILAP